MVHTREVRSRPITPVGEVFGLVLTEFRKSRCPLVLLGYFTQSNYGVIADLFVAIVQQVGQGLQGVSGSALAKCNCRSLNDVLVVGFKEPL